VNTGAIYTLDAAGRVVQARMFASYNGPASNPNTGTDQYADVLFNPIP